MVGSPGCGCMALTHIARILPGVSFPSRVVRSIIRIARSRAHIFEAFLIDRRLSASTRSSTPTWSTVVTRPSRLPSGPGRASHAATSSCARSRATVSGRRVVVMGGGGYTRASRGRPSSCDTRGMNLFDLPLDQLERYEPDLSEPADFDAFWGAT